MSDAFELSNVHLATPEIHASIKIGAVQVNITVSPDKFAMGGARVSPELRLAISTEMRRRALEVIAAKFAQDNENDAISADHFKRNQRREQTP